MLATIALDALQSRILKLLDENPLSLAALQLATEVSLPTLRRAMSDLSAARWIKIVGRSNGTVGRPAALYGLDDASYLILGAHLRLPGMRLVATTLSGAALDEWDADGAALSRPDEVIRAISHYYREIRARFPLRPILGVGLAAPGYTDPGGGEILWIGRASADWSNFPIKARLQAGLGIPVTVDNDVDCAAVAELRARRASASGDLIYLGLYEGLKASMFLGGRLYKGPFGNAGIIGRNIILSEGPLRSYLEESVSVPALCRRFAQRLAQDPRARKPSHAAIEKLRHPQQQFAAILAAATEGDALCAGIVDDMIAHLAAAAANLIYIIQPRLLILGGGLSVLPPDLRARLEGEIRAYLAPLLSNHLVIQQAQLRSETAIACGAAGEFLRRALMARIAG